MQAQAAQQEQVQEQYDRACYDIVEEINDKFIDLCVDDNNSSIGNRMPAAQAAFRSNLETLSMTFQTSRLDMPKRMESGNEALVMDKDIMQSLCAADDSMGKDLDAIFGLIDG